MVSPRAAASRASATYRSWFLLLEAPGMRGFASALAGETARPCVAILPTFVDETRPLIGQATILSILYVVIATVVHSAIVLLADAARPWLEDERRNMMVRRVLSLLLMAIAVWLFAATRQGAS